MYDIRKAVTFLTKDVYSSGQKIGEELIVLFDDGKLYRLNEKTNGPNTWSLIEGELERNVDKR